MADVNFFDAFGYKWALVGPAENLQDDQYKVGWGFIGAVPPSVEQFNRVHQVADEKSNYLYSQLKTIYDLTGVVPGAAVVTSLRDALRGTGLFQTAAPGTNDTSAATTAFVGTAIGAARGRLIGLRAISASQAYVPTPGTNLIVVTLVGAGGGGGGAQTTGAGQWSAGAGGAGGGWTKKLITAGFSGALITIGVGGGGSGGGSGGSGGTTSFGAICSATGGTGGSFGTAGSFTGANGFAAGGAGSLGDLNGIGGRGNYAMYAPGPTSGAGGFSLLGDGAPWSTASVGPVNGSNGVAPGSGGSGGANPASGGVGATGGNGANGLCIIEEYA